MVLNTDVILKQKQKPVQFINLDSLLENAKHLNMFMHHSILFQNTYRLYPLDAPSLFPEFPGGDIHFRITGFDLVYFPEPFDSSAYITLQAEEIFRFEKAIVKRPSRYGLICRNGDDGGTA